MAGISRAEKARREELRTLGLKWCPGCTSPQPIENFHANRARRDGVAERCKPCSLPGAAERSARRRALNPSAAADGWAAWRARQDPAELRRRACNYAENRRALIASVYVEDIDRDIVWERDGGVCYLCGRSADPDKWHLDHVIPISKGGEHSYKNVAVSHPACNLAKGTRLPG